MIQTPIVKRKHFLNIISLCCSNDPQKATKLLYECNGQKAKNQEDLEHKIALAYKDSDDKISIEKKLAEMHPDKDFILKYNKPKVVVAKEELIDVKDKPKESVDALVKTINEVEKATSLETSSNYGGNPNCSCGKQSYASGNNEQIATQQQVKNDHTQLIIAVFGITAIFGMALIISKNKI